MNKRGSRNCAGRNCTRRLEMTEMEENQKVRAIEVNPAPLNDSRRISKARGAMAPRASEKRPAPLMSMEKTFLLRPSTGLVVGNLRAW